MSDEEASIALRDLLVHLQKRAMATVDKPDGLDNARQYEMCARVIAYFGTRLIAEEDIDLEEMRAERAESN